MKVLIVKTSSMGDVIHTLPALTDAGKQIPSIRFDWLVEGSFSEIPTWHPLVDKVIPIAFRRWRKAPFDAATRKEFTAFLKQLREESYDLIIDAQGLVKSGLFTLFARGTRCGADWNSAREKWASLFYQKKVTVPTNLQAHAVDRMRLLFAKTLGYELPNTPADYGLHSKNFTSSIPGNYVVFFHGTTWDTKRWPQSYWQTLLAKVAARGLQVLLPWGNQEEREFAESLATSHAKINSGEAGGESSQSPCYPSDEAAPAIGWHIPVPDGLQDNRGTGSSPHQQEAAQGTALVLPRLNISEMAGVIANAQAVVAVDTGLAHLAAALGIPTISLYGPTAPKLTGTVGDNQTHLAANFACAPCLKRTCPYPPQENISPACYTTVNPDRVWQDLQKILVT